MGDVPACEGCGYALTDCGPIGLACLNKDCTFEQDMVIRAMRDMRERRERAELSRLKAKYEAKP